MNEQASFDTPTLSVAEMEQAIQEQEAELVRTVGYEHDARETYTTSILIENAIGTFGLYFRAPQLGLGTPRKHKPRHGKRSRGRRHGKGPGKLHQVVNKGVRVRKH